MIKKIHAYLNTFYIKKIILPIETIASPSLNLFLSNLTN